MDTTAHLISVAGKWKPSPPLRSALNPSSILSHSAWPTWLRELLPALRYASPFCPRIRLISFTAGTRCCGAMEHNSPLARTKSIDSSMKVRSQADEVWRGAYPFQSGVSLAKYVRIMVHDHILQRGAAFRERGAAFRALVKTGKAWVIGTGSGRSSFHPELTLKHAKPVNRKLTFWDPMIVETLRTRSKTKKNLRGPPPHGKTVVG